MASKLIPAVAYLRKSTKGKKKDGKERQEKSIPGQRGEIEKHAKAHGCTIVREYADEGRPGWMRGDNRPGFQQMLREVRERRDVQAVICDDIDRFTRADPDEAISDLCQLKEAGVKYLISVNQGDYKLGGMADLAGILRLVIDLHGNNQFCRKLGRRLAIARCNKAKDGKRSGGVAPYGYQNDDKGGLIVNSDTSPIVVQMFESYLVGARSVLSIANELNQQGVPGPRGGHWSRETVSQLLRNRVYCGAFVYNRKQSGQFYIVDSAHEVKPAEERTRPNWLRSDDAAIIRENRHPPLVSVEDFDKVQRKLKSRKQTGHRNPTGGYALTGMLVCGHCGGPLWGFQRRGVKHYRCDSSNRKGGVVCRSYEVREDEILPYVLKRLRDELGTARILALQPKPAKPFEVVPGRLDQLRRQHEDVTKIISSGRKNLLSTENPELLKMMQEDMSEAIAEQKRLAAEIEAASVPVPEHHAAILLADFTSWLDDHERRIVEILAMFPPLKPNPQHIRILDPDYVTTNTPAATWDVPTLRQQLLELGVRVTLWWEPVQLGKRTIYRLASGRFEMGNSESPLPVHQKWQGMSGSAR